MKRARLAVLVATAAFAATAFAATPTSAPVMPSDLATAWKSVASDHCTTPNGDTVARAQYAKNGSRDVILEITVNGNLVGFRDMSSEITLVKQSDGSWLAYDRKTEGEAKNEAFERAMTVTNREYQECVGR